MHQRYLPKVNRFSYSLYYLLTPLTAIEDGSLQQILPVNRWGWHSFYESDHGLRDGSSLRAWVEAMHTEHKLPCPEHIYLICLPRILGFVFNPVSFWIGTNAKHAITSIIYEVNNTFGETHSYLCANQTIFNQKSQAAELPEIKPDQWLSANKVLHVSPFFAVQGSYKFQFSLNNSATKILINYQQGSEVKLQTSLIGRQELLTKSRLYKASLTMPLITLRVIYLIHYQALRLILKKAKFFPKPKPPLTTSSKSY